MQLRKLGWPILLVDKWGLGSHLGYSRTAYFVARVSTQTFRPSLDKSLTEAPIPDNFCAKMVPNHLQFAVDTEMLKFTGLKSYQTLM